MRPIPLNKAVLTDGVTIEAPDSVGTIADNTRWRRPVLIGVEDITSM